VRLQQLRSLPDYALVSRHELLALDAGLLAHLGDLFEDDLLSLKRESIEGLPTSVRFNRCIATRVGPGGLHHRVIHKEHCDEIASAAAMLEMTGADDGEGGATPSAATTALSTDSTISPFGGTPELRLARLKRDHPALNDFVSRDQERRLEVVCGDGSFDDCKALATKIYRSLSPEQRRQVREAMRSTIGK
jgi:hypothetical protein